MCTESDTPATEVDLWAILGSEHTYVMTRFASGGAFVGGPDKVLDVLQDSEDEEGLPFDRLFVIVEGGGLVECVAKRRYTPRETLLRITAKAFPGITLDAVSEFSLAAIDEEQQA